jgi:hypothetical protein
MMTHPPTELLIWLHRLDSYSNEEYGRARTLSAIRLECVACGRSVASTDEEGLCRRCVAQQRTAEPTARVDVSIVS